MEKVIHKSLDEEIGVRVRAYSVTKWALLMLLKPNYVLIRSEDTIVINYRIYPCHDNFNKILAFKAMKVSVGSMLEDKNLITELPFKISFVRKFDVISLIEIY